MKSAPPPQVNAQVLRISPEDLSTPLVPIPIANTKRCSLRLPRFHFVLTFIICTGYGGGYDDRGGYDRY